MAATGFLREDFVEGDPVRKVCSATQARRIARILNSIEGVGCIVERCYSQEGFGWKIVVPQSPYTTKTDTDGYDVAKDPDGRQTVQRNPQGYPHSKELQLHNVHLVKDGSKSIPFFVSETPLQGGLINPDKVVGELYWATFDADRLADPAEKVYRSLTATDVHATGVKGKYSLSLYGFPTCGVSTVPYAKEVTNENPLLNGRELEWRYPATFEGSPSNEENSYDSFAVGLVGNNGPPSSGSYATFSYYSRNLTVNKGAINIGSGAGPAYVYALITIDQNDIDPTPSGEIVHNETDGTATSPYPAWTDSNNGHDGRYLRIGKNWATGETYNNICTGIAHAADGTRAIDLANGLIYGDDPAEGEKIDYGAQKLFAWKSSAKVEMLDWKDQKLRAESVASPWTAELAFRIASSDPAKYVDFVVGDGTLEIKDQTGARLAYFRKVA
jgi:hypothetical protein